MPEAVRQLDPGEISLNAVRYRLVGAVQPQLTSVYPQKVVFGDVSKDSQPGASVFTWHDWRDGIGIERMAERESPQRSWWSTCQLRFAGHLLLPPLAVQTAASGVAGSFNIGAMGELADEVYAAFGTAIRKYNNVTDSWGSTLFTLPANATHALSFRLGGVNYLAFATTGGYTYTSDGVVFTDDTTDTKFLFFWDTRLWGIDNAGQLWRSTAIGVEVNDATIPLPAGNVSGLLSARNAAGAIVLYVPTKEGMYQHDATNAKFDVAEPSFPPRPDNDISAARWRDAVYVSAGLGIYSVVNGANQAVVTLVGPDRDHGLPTAQQGSIVKLVGEHNDLLALIDGTTAAPEVDMFDSGGLGSHTASVINADVGFSEILGWNGRGWECKWLAAASTAAADYMIISSAYSKYRLWWAHNQRVYYLDLQRGITNPDQLTAFAYAASGEHITPWLTIEAKDVNALAMELSVEVQRATAAETVVVDYATNYSATWTLLGTITANGTTTYSFPNSTTPTGTDFRAIRFRFTLARGTVNTNSPDVVSVTFVYRKKLKPKWGATFVLDLTAEYKGRTPRQMQDALVTAAESTTRIEFTFHDDTTAGSPRNYYVDITALPAQEGTGDDYSGLVSVTVTEP